MAAKVHCAILSRSAEHENMKIWEKKLCGRVPIPPWLLCLLALLACSSAFAADNAALGSVAVPPGSPILPGTIFTQTWTMTNTGTTTWSPGNAGYTLRLVGLDSLGAVPLTVDGSSACFPPSATIVSGKSIAPGGVATFSLTLIAPEAAGSVTDTFQMCNAKGSNFGPLVSAQIVVTQNGPSNQFDRAGAVSYANNYAGVVVSDGYFWINGSTYNYFGPGSPAPTNLPNEASGIGDDCAHFCSSCLGNQPGHRGGGFNIASRVPPTYGEPGAQRLIYTNLISKGLAEEVYSLSDLAPGDLIGWNWEGDTNTAYIDHVTIYLGNGVLASHAQSALDVSATTYFQSALPDWRWHLIHIYDAAAPTTTSLSSMNAATYGNEVVLTATVTPTPSAGTVQFYDNGADMGGPLDASGGSVSYFTTYFSAGSHAITSAYSGAAQFQASATVTPSMLTVNPAPLNITPNPQSKVYGNSLVFGGPCTQFSCSGLQNGESIGSIVLIDTNNGGAPNAPVGTYPLIPCQPTGGTFNSSNYNISFLPGTLNVTLPLNTIPVNVVGMTFPGDGSAHLSFTGTPGYVYLVQAASNLTPPVTWTTLGTTAADSNGLFTFMDPGASNCTARYYRTSIH
jgi:hypothetical protein